MAFLDPTRIFNNLIVLFVLGWIFFLVYSKMDKERMKQMADSFKSFFGGKRDE